MDVVHFRRCENLHQTRCDSVRTSVLELYDLTFHIWLRDQALWPPLPVVFFSFFARTSWDQTGGGVRGAEVSVFTSDSFSLLTASHYHSSSSPCRSSPTTTSFIVIITLFAYRLWIMTAAICRDERRRKGSRFHPSVFTNKILSLHSCTTFKYERRGPKKLGFDEKKFRRQFGFASELLLCTLFLLRLVSFSYCREHFCISVLAISWLLGSYLWIYLLADLILANICWLCYCLTVAILAF